MKLSNKNKMVDEPVDTVATCAKVRGSIKTLVIFGLLSLRLLCAQTFTETFNEGTLNTSVWTASNYETNNYAGGGSNVTFSPANISLAGGNLQMMLTQPTSGTSTGAELTSVQSFGYGTYQFSMRAGSTQAVSIPWPGQAGNSVGYAAYGTLGTTPWPGGGFTNGTAGHPTVYTGYVFTGALTISGSYITFVSCDFNSGTGGVNVTGSNITFDGDRFQSNQVENYNVQSSGTNIVFSYSSFAPLASLYTSPPGSVWPSAGAGQNTTTQTTDVNAINGNSGYEYGLNITSGGPVTVDHSDFWGFGNAIVLYSTTAQMTLTNNWIHDAANASPQGYHTDGIGYLNGGAGPSNVLVQGNTIASLGNTNGLAFQAATSGYNNIQFIANYLSGFGYTIAAGAPGTTHFTNSSIAYNVWGTDIEPVWNPLYGNSWTAGTNSTWTCNTLAWRTGTTWTDGDGWTPTSAINGEYFVPTSGISSTTDYLGNASCPAPQSPVTESGQISSTFIIDYVSGSSVTEIDAPEIEGLSARSNNIEWDIWKNGVSTVPSPEFNVLANPEAAFHIYKFVWTSGSITFYIDNVLVSTGTSGIPTAPAVIDINFYGTNSTGWGGDATVGVTRFMYVNSVSYTPLGGSVSASGGRLFF